MAGYWLLAHRAAKEFANGRGKTNDPKVLISKARSPPAVSPESVRTSRLLDTDFRIGEHSKNLHLQIRFSVLSSEFAYADELAGAVLGE
jgi:hypothetical protein